MLTEKDLYNYQKAAISHALKHDACGLFLGLGCGKTVSTLTAVNELLQSFEVSKVLVIAPLHVAETVWSDEINNWQHLRHLNISKVMGSERDRKKALLAKADIYIINRENVVWLVSQYGAGWPFDALVIDELSSFKSAKAQRFKALRKVRPYIRRVIGLTGTPAPNSSLDLWSQLYLIDQGERLGKSITQFREKYFIPDKRNGNVVYSYRERKDYDEAIFGKNYYEKEIHQKIADICISMKSKDYLDLPDTIFRELKVHLSADQKKRYDDFERQQVLSLTENGGEITAVNAAALSTKLLQFANGAIYDAEKVYHEIHSAKLDAIDEIIDTATSPVLIFYWYKHDLERLQLKLARFKPEHINTAGNIEKWNQGKINVLFAHPASAGHGLNLQFGGSTIIWFSQTWSLELYQQANGRLNRPGQKNTVIINNLIAVGTMDEDVFKSRARKEVGQDALMEAVRARVEKYVGVLS